MSMWLAFVGHDAARGPSRLLTACGRRARCWAHRKTDVPTARSGPPPPALRAVGPAALRSRWPDEDEESLWHALTARASRSRPSTVASRRHDCARTTVRAARSQPCARASRSPSPPGPTPWRSPRSRWIGRRVSFRTLDHEKVVWSANSTDMPLLDQFKQGVSSKKCDGRTENRVRFSVRTST